MHQAAVRILIENGLCKNFHLFSKTIQVDRKKRLFSDQNVNYDCRKKKLSKISPGKTPGLLKCMYQHNIILFCNYYGALLKKNVCFTLSSSGRIFLFGPKKRLLWGENSTNSDSDV